MMASQSELSLECKSQSYSMLLKSFADHNNPSDNQATQKLEEYLNRLEEERLKIDAFKRELPLCMQLLTNAMEASRQQLQSYRANNQGGRPVVLEEFMPLKHSNNSEVSHDQKTTNMSSDKTNWMTSAQLWSQASDHIGKNHHQQQPSTTLPKTEGDISFSVSPKLGLDNTKQRNGGAFLPFAKDRHSGSSPNNDNSSIIRALPDLALASNEGEIEDKIKCTESENGINNNNNNGSRSTENSSKGGNNGEAVKGADSQATTTATTAHRKARRCWSPDLHRRFVNALQMLGGSQVATPKQIRELMKVDGLTNDEVKSHLQKYRLHTRRPSPSPQAAGGPGPQLVVLGGIWVPPEYAAAAAAHGGGPTIYGAHHPTSQVSPHHHHYAMSPQDHFYPPPPPPPPPHGPPQHHPGFHHHHQLHHVYKATSHNTQTHSSPESDAQGAAGDRSESIEDGKSESGGSWKGESGGENNGGGERKKLAAFREDGDESNGSEITLKF